MEERPIKKGLNKKAIKAFWEEKSNASSNRWSGSQILEFEKELLMPFASNAKTILDLGSGHGELSKSILPKDAKLIAVDYIENYSRYFQAPGHYFVRSSVLDYSIEVNADLALLFGVVTYLNIEEEKLVYQNLLKIISQEGWAVVKNQCSSASEIIYDGFSEDLGAQYSARYPRYLDQFNRLKKIFSKVEPLIYPDQFNKWENTFHVAFFCQK